MSNTNRILGCILAIGAVGCDHPPGYEPPLSGEYEATANGNYFDLDRDGIGDIPFAKSVSGCTFDMNWDGIPDYFVMVDGGSYSAMSHGKGFVGQSEQEGFPCEPRKVELSKIVNRSKRDKRSRKKRGRISPLLQPGHPLYIFR